MNIAPRISERASSQPASIGLPGYDGTVRSAVVMAPRTSREIRLPGVTVSAHAMTGVKGNALVITKYQEIHFTWKSKQINGIARCGKTVREYGNQPRYSYLMPPGVKVEFDLEKSDFRILNVQLDQEFLRVANEYWNTPSIDIPETWEYEDALSWEIAGALYKECMSGATNGLMYAETALSLLAQHTVRTLSALGRAPNLTARGGIAPVVLRRVCQYMEEHMHEDITLHELAALAGVTPNHFSVAFKRSTGMPPHAWFRRRRIDRAKDLLRIGKTDVATVALLVGYENQSSFGVAFRRETGMTPTQWRGLA
jgi:AraC family transcriptional regulator